MAWSTTMVDMPSPYSPSSPVGDSVLGSPLCGDLIQDMEELEDLSQSIEEDTFNSFDVHEHKSSSTGSECSTALGDLAADRSTHILKSQMS